jgi:hypothetical protein
MDVPVCKARQLRAEGLRHGYTSIGTRLHFG